MSWDGERRPYDGMALAQSIIGYIHDRTGAKTLFATHYHELTALSETLSVWKMSMLRPWARWSGYFLAQD